MNAQELQKRIDNKKTEITKIEKRIAKWTNGLRPQDIAILEPFSNCTYGTAPRGTRWDNYHGTEAYQLAYQNYRAYKEREENNIPSSDDWNKGPNFSEAYTAYRDLGEARNTLINYQIQLEKLTNFENEEKIKALWDFLCEWETKCYNWYLKNAEKYFELTKNYKEAKAKWKMSYLELEVEPSKEDVQAHKEWKYWFNKAEISFEIDYYSGINSLTRELTRMSGHYISSDISCTTYEYDSYTVDTEKLSQILKEEKSRKYQDLVKRVTAVVGNITDASELSIGKQNGEINGIVIGDKSKAKVETISAGGYNIQCFHYRVLVNELH